MEREIISKTNQKGFIGFPTLLNLPQAFTFESIPATQLVVTDLLGSSLSWFSKQKALTLAQVHNIGI